MAAAPSTCGQIFLKVCLLRGGTVWGQAGSLDKTSGAGLLHRRGDAAGPNLLPFASLRDVTFGEFGAFAEEKLFHLLFHDFLRIGIEGIQAVLVHDHF
jgi:hypothetical protein